MTQFYEIVVYRSGAWHLDAITAHKGRALKDAENISNLYGYSVYVATHPDGDRIAEYNIEEDDRS